MFNRWVNVQPQLEPGLGWDFLRARHSAALRARTHGPWLHRSWDRQPIIRRDEETSAFAIDPATHQLRSNFIFNTNFLGKTNSG